MSADYFKGEGKRLIEWAEAETGNRHSDSTRTTNLYLRAIAYLLISLLERPESSNDR